MSARAVVEFVWPEPKPALRTRKCWNVLILDIIYCNAHNGIRATRARHAEIILQQQQQHRWWLRRRRRWWARPPSLRLRGGASVRARGLCAWWSHINICAERSRARPFSRRLLVYFCAARRVYVANKLITYYILYCSISYTVDASALKIC